MFKIESWYKLRKKDFGGYRHLDSRRYFRYSKKSRHELQEKLNIPDSALIKRDIGFFVGERGIRHKKQIKTKKIKVVSLIREMPRRQVVTINQEFYNGLEELCATGFITQVFVNLDSGKMIMPPEDFMQTLKGYF